MYVFRADHPLLVNQLVYFSLERTISSTFSILQLSVVLPVGLRPCVPFHVQFAICLVSRGWFIWKILMIWVLFSIPLFSDYVNLLLLLHRIFLSRTLNPCFPFTFVTQVSAQELYLQRHPSWHVPLPPWGPALCQVLLHITLYSFVLELWYCLHICLIVCLPPFKVHCCAAYAICRNTVG